MLQLAQPADREAVEALAQEVHALHVSWRPDLFAPAQVLYTGERFAEAVKQRQLYVAKIDSMVVGYGLLRIRMSEGPGRIPRRIMLVDEFCVKKTLRNHGIGRQMMEDIRALAKAFGCTDLQLGVYPQNDAAVAFYQKCGFAIRSIDMQRKV